MAVPYDIVVIGGGSGGLVAASFAAQLKAKVALVEREERIGGDCLWYGCVPSKSLIHVSRLAHETRQAAQTGLILNSGINGSGPDVDYLKVYQHIKAAQNFIANHADSPDRFRKLGVDLIFGSGRFLDKQTFEVNGRQLKGRAFIIATGSRPQVPPVPGLEEVGYLTNEKIFDLTNRPASVAVIGAGPIGCELGQALSRLGSRVILIASRETILPKEDPEAARVVQQQLQREGIEIISKARAESASQQQGKKQLRVSGQVLTVDEIVVAAGRVPNVEELNLEAAGVGYDPSGIKVDKHLRTSNPKVYACGDVIGGYQFTHVAGYEGFVAATNALLLPLVKAKYRVIPWATFTDPELARVGLTEAEARQQYTDVVVLKHDFAEVDRAQAEAATVGFAKLICRRKGEILGAHLVGASAGELLSEIVLAMNYQLPVSALTGMHIYPTLSEVNAKAALQLAKQKYAKNLWQQNLLQNLFSFLRSLG
ncbi:MAG: FAD-dependent oxidoreductase [Cyanobacteriota bacterium]|nr:FAD-dependent oxidoreductase [Cyanobacteriota bacterium]